MTERTEIATAEQMAEFARAHVRDERHLRRGLFWSDPLTALAGEDIADISDLLTAAARARDTATPEDAAAIEAHATAFAQASTGRDFEASVLASCRLLASMAAARKRSEANAGAKASAEARKVAAAERLQEWRGMAADLWRAHPRHSAGRVAELIALRISGMPQGERDRLCAKSDTIRKKIDDLRPW